MGIKTAVEIFKKWENPLIVELELDIFPTTNQALKLCSNLNRDVQDGGVFYSASLSAKSDVSMFKKFYF